MMIDDETTIALNATEAEILRNLMRSTWGFTTGTRLEEAREDHSWSILYRKLKGEAE